MAKVAKTKKKVGGRKLFDGKGEKAVVQKLEYVWALGGTDAEAASYAGISKAALSDYLKKHEEVSERKVVLKHKPILQARMTVVGNLDDCKVAMWYLQTKKRDEFGKYAKNDTETIKIDFGAEAEARLKKWL